MEPLNKVEQWYGITGVYFCGEGFQPFEKCTFAVTKPQVKLDTNKKKPAKLNYILQKK